MIEAEWTRYVWLSCFARYDSRQNHWIEISISGRQACIWPWLLIETCRAERTERQRLKEAVHRYNSKSNLRQRVLWAWTCVDTSQSNIWDVDKQSKHDYWIHQCHQTCVQERLYNLIIKTKWPKHKKK